MDEHSNSPHAATLKELLRHIPYAENKQYSGHFLSILERVD